jgi:ubiquinone/menaquinone biosynthesis C-methylase UbiE
MKPDQESKALSQERFARFADQYVSSQSHAKGDDLDRLVEISDPQAGWLVLDIATGGGHTALKFAPYVRQVIATDITPEMLSRAKKYILDQGVTNVAFGPADAENLPFEDCAFDLVTCRIAPHHFPDCARFVQEGSRVLKPGGLLLVQDHVLPEDVLSARYIDQFERLRDPSHNRAFSRAEWQQMFDASGLDVRHVQEITKRHQLFPWAERQQCSAETIEQLIRLLVEAPPKVAEWLQSRDLGTHIASFVNHHILISGMSPGEVHRPSCRVGRFRESTA